MQKKYLITGASSGIGTALLQRLLHIGTPDDTYALFGSGDTHLLTPLAQQYPGRLHIFDADLTTETGLENLVATAKDVLGTPTHFVHLPALRVINTKFKNFDEKRFSLDMQLQVFAAAEICKQFLPGMAKQKYGRVLFMLTSYVIGTPPKNTAAYVMVKQALLGLAKSLAADYAHLGITVNCVAPAMMETAFLADTPPLIVQAAAEANPLGRNLTPADVAPAMQFLLSDDAACITGVVLPITGGA